MPAASVRLRVHGLVGLPGCQSRHGCLRLTAWAPTPLLIPDCSGWNRHRNPEFRCQTASSQPLDPGPHGSVAAGKRTSSGCEFADSEQRAKVLRSVKKSHKHQTRSEGVKPYKSMTYANTCNSQPHAKPHANRPAKHLCRPAIDDDISARTPQTPARQRAQAGARPATLLRWRPAPSPTSENGPDRVRSCKSGLAARLKSCQSALAAPRRVADGGQAGDQQGVGRRFWHSQQPVRDDVIKLVKATTNGH